MPLRTFLFDPLIEVVYVQRLVWERVTGVPHRLVSLSPSLPPSPSVSLPFFFDVCMEGKYYDLWYYLYIYVIDKSRI